MTATRKLALDQRKTLREENQARERWLLMREEKQAREHWLRKLEGSRRAAGPRIGGWHNSPHGPP